jgi:hypothetical protein
MLQDLRGHGAVRAAVGQGDHPAVPGQVGLFALGVFARGEVEADIAGDPRVVGQDVVPVRHLAATDVEQGAGEKGDGPVEPFENPLAHQVEVREFGRGPGVEEGLVAGRGLPACLPFPCLGRLDAPYPGVIDFLDVEEQIVLGRIVENGLFAAIPRAVVVDLHQGPVVELIEEIVQDAHGRGVPVRIQVQHGDFADLAAMYGQGGVEEPLAGFHDVAHAHTPAVLPDKFLGGGAGTGAPARFVSRDARVVSTSSVRACRNVSKANTLRGCGCVPDYQGQQHVDPRPPRRIPRYSRMFSPHTLRARSYNTWPLDA